MAKIINVVPLLRIRNIKAKGYGVQFEKTFNLTAYVDDGDIDNRDYKDEQKAINSTIEAFDELLDMWRYGDLDEAIEDARELRKMDDLD